MRWLFAFVVAVITAGLSAGAIDAGRSVDVARVSVGSVVNIDVTLRNGAAHGTGMVVSRNGLVVTNNHVIRGATSVRVADVGNGRTYPARVLGYSVVSDVAVLQLGGAAALQTAPFSGAHTLKLRQRVTAFGNAGGLGGTRAPGVRSCSQSSRALPLRRPACRRAT